MKTHYSRFVSMSLLIALLMAMIPVPVYAAHTISSVTPPVFTNDVDNTITITGAGFTSSSEVSLGSIPLLRLTQSDAEITALVPKDTPAGSYAVTVSIGADVASCASPCITINVPTATATSAPVPFGRPQLVVSASKIIGDVTTNSQFKMNITLGNAGTSTAYNVQAVFSSTDLAPLKNGGVAAIGTIDEGSGQGVSQNFLVTGQIYGQAIVMVDVTVTYYDEKGT